MPDDRWPDTRAPYMTWAKHRTPARYDLFGSNLLPCTLDDFPEARDALRLYGRNDDGWPPLVRAIAARYGLPENRVTTATGGSGANFLALAATVTPGDTVLAEWPGYDPQMGAARFLGAQVRTFDRGWDRRFALDPAAVEDALTPDTRAILLTNLHNPSSVHAEADALMAVGALARSVGARVIVDEVYLDAAPDPVDRTPAALRDPVFISTSSLTKSYGLAGIRVGWMLAEPELTERALRVRDVTEAVGSIPSETIGVAAFEHLDRLLDRARGLLAAGRDRFRRFMVGRSDLEWVEPVGGSVVFPRMRDSGDAEPFVDFAAAEYEVGLTPGRFFGEPAHFRVSLAGPPDVLDAGLERLDAALDAWGRMGR